MSPAAPTSNWFTPLLDDSTRFISANWHGSFVLLTTLATLTLLLVGAIWLRHRRSRTDGIHRTPWPANSRKNRPHSASLMASGAYRQRRRRRRSTTSPKPS